ncbi:HAD hydrolase-like protein [Telmatocola sphagniphila]|jgi:phosphonatase-like hydrolase|uniref:HAD hydrolase-like protein n=1 Tax=Telmatocola sphagniphila TaxID=1123043 RepID=A0A8E6B492_9BACT|nr:HAD hydrolase-like protein [Telmatocola sphagniphila]QVL30080.1 HAD hydrolase-like protein [Telmatocola sphagniphila]
MPIELVVCDIAGTSLEDNDAVSHCFREALSEAGLQAPSTLINSVMGIHKPLAIRQIISEIGGTHKEAFLAQADVIHHDFVKRMIDYYTHDPEVREVPGASRVFAELRAAGIKIALDTGFGRKITNVIIERLAWKNSIDASLCSDEVLRGRPHPDLILQLMGILGVSDPKKVCKIGDTPSDLQQGTKAGCGYVVGVTQGSHTREQLMKEPHTHLIGTIAELPKLLGIA